VVLRQWPVLVLISFSARKIKLTTVLSGLLFHPSGNFRLMGKETGNSALGDAEARRCPLSQPEAPSAAQRLAAAAVLRERELGLADFAIVQSYLSTTAKWGIDALDALTWLFTDGPWLPPATAPP
jgi:hypothetical protein